MSTLTISNLNDGTTTVPTTFVTNGSAKAFGRVNQTATGHPVFAQNLNVSSTTDGGTGITSISFSNNMSSNEYTIAGSTDFGTDTYSQFQYRYIAAGSISVYNSPDYNQNIEDGKVGFVIHGDLA